MLTIIRTEQRQLSTEAQAFFAEGTRASSFARIIGFVAAIDAACVVCALLAA